MKFVGKSLIGGEWKGSLESAFTAINPTTNKIIPQKFSNASSGLVDKAIEKANDAFMFYSEVSSTNRAIFLRCIVKEILAIGTFLIDTAHKETGLPRDRLEVERSRTIQQLNLFADQIETQEYHPVIDIENPRRTPTAKPDLRLGYLPLGVVGVFAASNFPFAYSTAGGDTASALASGCCVVMKAHTSHPATSELVGVAISNALKLCDLPQGVFSLIQGDDYEISSQIVKHPAIKAVGFTGSERVGMILQRKVFERDVPIPFYGELGSVNPQFIMPHKLHETPLELAEMFITSLTLGCGQFCTSPGLWVVGNDNGDGYSEFINTCTRLIKSKEAEVMLTPDIASNYQKSVNTFKNLEGVHCLGTGKKGKENHLCSPALFETNVSTFLTTPILWKEVFGSCAIIVRCESFEEMLKVVHTLQGNLTASIHAEGKDMIDVNLLTKQVIHKVGRIIYNQMSTGVEVSPAMNHGGPFPASTDVRTTSVGSEALKRFMRPICFQNMPSELLPGMLK